MNLESSDAPSREEHLRLALLESLISKPVRRKEIDLRQLGEIVWRYKWLVVAVTAVFSLTSLWLAFYLPNKYTATAILEPAPSASGGSGLEKLAGAFGSIAGLGNMDFSGSSDEERPEEAQALLKNQGFLEDFIRKYHLEVAVYAASGWDPKTNRLIIDPKIYNEKEQRWIAKFKTPEGIAAAPTGWDLYQAFKSRISVSEDKNDNLVTVNVEFYSPFIAKQWADELIAELNGKFETQDRMQAAKSIEYLHGELTNTPVDIDKTFLYLLLEQQTQKLMLTKVSNGYVFATLVPAEVPDRKSSPKRLLILVLGTILGGGIAVAAAAVVDKSRTAQLAVTVEPNRAHGRRAQGQ
ncbi:MAG TPA: Wzz/FepE/Etk N-terminal domain-containing protein [Steroidobacteraceae bacterium]|jgi:uncharacterized protein involved in exopolysaccharide biosynthesis